MIRFHLLLMIYNGQGKCAKDVLDEGYYEQAVRKAELLGYITKDGDGKLALTPTGQHFVHQLREAVRFEPD